MIVAPSRTVVPLALLITMSLAGCLSGGPTGSGPDGGGEGAGPAANWTAPLVRWGTEFTPTHIIDPVRAGGEPVIAITQEGTIIVSSHPGYTHYHPTPASPELIQPTQTQSYLWRSTDGGQSWTRVSLLPGAQEMPNSGPRGLGQGVSDPDLTIDGNGRIYLTDLEALASASVSWSDDDGQTWIMGNNLASGGVIDRQWLASHGSTVYFTGNYLGTSSVWPGGEPGVKDFLRSEDGLVWEARGYSPCNGDPVVNPLNGVIYQACGGQAGGFTFSADGGATWQRAEGPVGCGLCEIGIDAAGTIYQAGVRDSAVAVAFTRDDGQTWSEPLNVSTLFDEFSGESSGPMIWPWVSAGSEGRLAVSWLAAPGASGARDPAGQWHAYTVLITNATGNGTTELWPVKLTTEPLHIGAVCVGTTCQVKTPDQNENDRRLGDFFETTISPDGWLHVVYTNTQAYPSHGVGHVAFHKQVGGPSLVVGEVPPGFPTQG